jgi:hypothetical protein
MVIFVIVALWSLQSTISRFGIVHADEAVDVSARIGLADRKVA